MAFAGEVSGAEWTLDGCCCPGVLHFPTVCPQKSGASGQEGCPPYFGFWFEILDGITGLSLKDDSLTCQGIHTDLHLCVLAERKRGNYMESRKMVLKNLPAGQQWRNRHGEQT